MSSIALKIISAFNPIIEMLQAMSYPLTFIAAACGVLLITIGQKRKGLEMIKWATVGFLLMQLLPGFMKMLMEVGRAMAK